MDDDAVKYLADISGGDARKALNALELAAETTEIGADGRIHITMEVIEDCVQKKAITFDKSGKPIMTISVPLSNLCGAAILTQRSLYLARALYAGEDPNSS